MAICERILLQPPELAGRSVELFVAEPGEPRGAILFVHGHQGPARMGGRDMVENGALLRIANTLLVAAASVSQPGYGASDGPPDYCGPATQLAIRAALAHLCSRSRVDRDRIVLYGVSRGATASAMVAASEPELRAVVLVAGAYDLIAAYPAAPPGTRRNIELEAGIDRNALEARSAIYHADEIRAEMLILHGRRDDRVPVQQAEMFAAAAARGGATISLELFDCGHNIPMAHRRTAVRPLYGRVFS